jgi:hypothetical protein
MVRAMNESTHGEVIATRKLLLGMEDGASGEVCIHIEKPAPGPTEWRCQYRIAGPGIGIVNRAAGIDALQAIQLAIVMIETEIGVRFPGAQLRWEDGTSYIEEGPPRSSGPRT